MVRIAQALHEEVIAHCQREYPKEACGLLGGRAGVVAQVYPMRNVEQSPIGYSMDPTEQLAVDKQMRARQQQLVGIYHSHTASPAYPSSVDVNLALSPEVSYVLVSLQDRAHPEMKSYRIDGARILQEDVAVAV